MDYNIAIISLGGVERILAPGPLTLTDAELEAHIANNVVGTKHSVSDVKAQVLVLEQEINKNAYKVNRQQAYPEVGEQLDMLWHAIDAGTLDKTSDFYTTLKQVKDTYPKV